MKKTSVMNENKTTKNAMNAPTVMEAVQLPYTVQEVSTRGKAIRNELKKIDGAFEKIAFNLHWFYVTEAFKAVNYKNIYDMAAKEFGISRGTTSNFINIVERFAERDENGKILDRIAERYSGFGSSKLILMLGCDEEKLLSINPKMSVREIKKTLSADKTSEAETEVNAVMQSEDIPEQEIKVTEINRQTLVSFRSMSEYNAYLDAMNDYIANTLSKKGNKYTVEIAITW